MKIEEEKQTEITERKEIPKKESRGWLWFSLFLLLVLSVVAVPLIHDVSVTDCRWILPEYHQLCLDNNFVGYKVEYGLLYCTREINGQYQEQTFDMDYYNKYLEAKCNK